MSIMTELEQENSDLRAQLGGMQMDIDELRAENERLEADNRSKNGSIKAFGEQIAKLQRAVKNRDKMLARLREESGWLSVKQE